MEIKGYLNQGILQSQDWLETLPQLLIASVNYNSIFTSQISTSTSFENKFAIDISSDKPNLVARLALTFASTSDGANPIKTFHDWIPLKCGNVLF